MTAKSPYLLVSYAPTNRMLPEPYQRIVVTDGAALFASRSSAATISCI